MKRSILNTFLLVGASALAFNGMANAQDAPEAEGEEKVLDTVITTGTSVDRSAFNTPTTVTSTTEQELRVFSGGSGSQADFLQQIPGVTAEGGGGEVASNFITRGLPGGGAGFDFNTLAYDGLPVLTAFGLNSSAADFFARNDLGIERLEYVKGSVANVYGAGAPAAFINYISKTGTDENHGTVQLEWAEEGRVRGDFAFQGPLAEDTYFAVSGFYRRDEGPLPDFDNPTEGYSLRGNIQRDFSDGSGFVRLHGTMINDRVQFFGSTFLDNDTRERIPGNDGQTVYLLRADGIDGVSVPTPEGIVTADAADGFFTDGGSVGLIFEKDLGDGWTVDTKAKFASYDTASNFFAPGIGVPRSQDVYVSGLGAIAPTGYSPTFTFAETGGALAANDLILDGRLQDRERDATDSSFEANLIKELPVGDITHNFTLGVFVSNSEADDNVRGFQFIKEFVNNPRLVNLEFVNDTDPTDILQYTVNGISNGNFNYQQATRSMYRQAVYFGDQIEADRWSLDAAVRIESATAENQFEVGGTCPSTLATNPVPGAPINTTACGTGNVRQGDATTTDVAYGIGGLYRLTDELNLFANYSRGYFFPQPRGTGGQINSVGDIAVYEAEPIIQAEAGFKYNNGRLNGSVTAFYTSLQDRLNVSFPTNDATNAVLTLTETEAIGLEIAGTYDLNEHIFLTGSLSLEENEFTESSNPAFVGNEFQRAPGLRANLGAVANYGPFDGSIFWNHRGETFQDPGNGVPLDALDMVRLDAGYTVPFNDSDLRFSVNVFNLFDTQGLQQGNARGGLVQSTDPAATFFVGRPVLPRRVTLRATLDF